MMLRTNHRRGGNVAALTAVSLVGLLGVAALTLDGGVLMDKRRSVQAAADAAALAGASDLYANWFTYYGKTDTPTGSGVKAAKAAAKANGYEDGVNGVEVKVYILPQSGPFASKDGHCEVIITASQKRFFSRLWGSDDISYGARAVARGKRGGISTGIMALAPSGKGSFTTGGGSGVTLTGAPLIVNSTDSQGLYANGNGTVSAPTFYLGGSPGWATPGGGIVDGTKVSNNPYQPDPLINLPVPVPTQIDNYGNPVDATHPAMTVYKNGYSQSGSGKTATLNPGVYQGGINIQGGSVTLNPGIYYMQGGGFNIGGQGSVVGAGVMIYNTGSANSDKIDISGQGSISLTPPTTGPYQGVLFFQDRTSTAPVNINGSSATAMTMTGTFYAASATLNVSGNGTQETIGAQYISYNVALGGNGTFSVNWSPDITPGVREVWLVE
jgi:hypothetical protein